MIDKNYCPDCSAFLPGESHKPMCSFPELIRAAKSLLEWVPVCSVGSSGYLRQEALRKAIKEFE